MRMYDLIEKKKRNEGLNREEIRFMVRGFVNGEIPDYQMAAMLMAVCFNGMDDEETTNLTLEMAHSGDMVDLSPIEGFKADKHSTGGVGDKTTLIVGPIVASLGVKVAKMSGRGLGHTGGTIDKLEAIPGFQTSIPIETFFEIVKKTGIAVVGQSGNLVPADKKIYALRDVTATVDSIPLIASSIMSKKLAAGSNGIVLDVKTGSGAFMKTLDDSITLAQKMVAIGNGAGRSCSALITDMDVPLGFAIGNSLEVMEAIDTLRGKGPEDLREVCLRLAAEMLHTAGRGNAEECYFMAERALEDGSAFETFKKMVGAQGGDGSFIDHPERFEKAPYCRAVEAPEDGYVSHMDTEGCGIASVLLKAGRSTKEDVIDNAAGIILYKKYGDYVKKGEPLVKLYASDESLFGPAEAKILSSYQFSDAQPQAKKLVYARVSKDGVER
ncbi:pyrimidine-nucleoside phosphorylase [[Clostridium] symbiosum]|uniref:pyrimidine-nucleoside phosphorylase n=1 Tax=Clostridium symbiosum TaxID=1512 RepID=UPI001D096E14|nr:pyrimidine-nucleoside phosphorylase [[Clostridium] symbiosum]MCB6609448.1 pyrimidine-nucleoside phosphorylase [[Clostridium] symbiosum]MCB6929180.1 pyrimidine-nucleoside phosphorylase [[Clostridium] symbiosum]